MNCPKCNKENIRAYINVQMYVDVKYAHHLTKKIIAKKSTELWSVSHDKTAFVCIDCYYSWGGVYNERIRSN